MKLWESWNVREKFKTEKSWKPQDYNKCNWKGNKWCLESGKCLGIVLVLAYLFYRSIWAVFPLLIPGCWFLKRSIRNSIRQNKTELKCQFKECLLAVSGSLKGGSSVENAFLESREDMKRLFGNDSMIGRELEVIRSGLLIHISLEEMLKDLGERSGDEDILQFSEIFRIARKSGGNIAEMLQATARQISDRIDAGLEAAAVLGARQTEQNIMRAMPLGILLYIECCTPGYFDSMYHNLQGVLIMTGCMGIYLAAFVVGDVIMKGIKEGSREIG